MTLRPVRSATALLPLLLGAMLGCDTGGGTDGDDDDGAEGDDGNEGDGSEGADEGNGESAEDWIGRSFILDVPANNWVEPPGVGSEIGAYVPLFLFEVTAATEHEVDVLMGTAADSETQDACSPTSELTGVVDAYPNLQIGPYDFKARIRNGDISVIATIHELTITNVLAAAGQEADEGVLTAVMDIRDVYPLFTLLPDPTPDSVCMAIQNSGSSCEPCPFDDTNYCLALRAVQLGAVEAPDITIETYTVDDVEGCSE